MTLVYLKGQGAITDMLSILGAQSARFAMEDAFIRKELRNNANRAVNCDSANAERSVIAASRQAQAIERLIAAKGEKSLPPQLLQTAKLRLMYPEVSLAGCVIRRWARAASTTGCAGSSRWPRNWKKARPGWTPDGADDTEVYTRGGEDRWN